MLLRYGFIKEVHQKYRVSNLSEYLTTKRNTMLDVPVRVEQISQRSKIFFQTLIFILKHTCLIFFDGYFICVEYTLRFSTV